MSSPDSELRPDGEPEPDRDPEPGGEPEPEGEPEPGGARRRALSSMRRDLHLALLSEIGARALTDHLSRRIRDEELARLTHELNREGIELVARVQGLLRDLGGRPRRTSLRRRALARLLVALRGVVGLRTVLRLLHHQEETLSRRYAEYALFLARMGDRERAEAFDALRAAKRRRADAVAAWLNNMARRAR